MSNSIKYNSQMGICRDYEICTYGIWNTFRSLELRLRGSDSDKSGARAAGFGIGMLGVIFESCYYLPTTTTTMYYYYYLVALTSYSN